MAIPNNTKNKGRLLGRVEKVHRAAAMVNVRFPRSINNTVRQHDSHSAEWLKKACWIPNGKTGTAKQKTKGAKTFPEYALFALELSISNIFFTQKSEQTNPMNEPSAAQGFIQSANGVPVRNEKKRPSSAMGNQSTAVPGKYPLAQHLP